VNPILLDIPEHIQTERLLLRVPKVGDGVFSNAAINESLAELKAWMPWAQEPHNLSTDEEFARRASAKFILREEFNFFIFQQGNQRMIGAIGLHHLDWSVPQGEIGYWLRSDATGNGYMTEAVKALTHYAFDRLLMRRVEVRCDADNLASKHVIERAGFEFLTMFRNDGLKPDGSLRNTLIYALTEAPKD
jgi:RimJ/RimL family protein N-acetyltransferase